MSKKAEQNIVPGTYNINEAIEAENKTDNQDNPTGGQVRLVIGPQNGARRHVLAVTWQDGPRKKIVESVDGKQTERLGDPNGAFVEDVLYAAYQRLGFFQQSKFACEENAVAMSHIQDALEALAKRSKDRAERGVLGSHEV